MRSSSSCKIDNDISVEGNHSFPEKNSCLSYVGNSTLSTSIHPSIHLKKQKRRYFTLFFDFLLLYPISNRFLFYFFWLRPSSSSICGLLHSFSGLQCWRVAFPECLLGRHWYVQINLSFQTHFALFLVSYIHVAFSDNLEQSAPKYMVDNQRNTFKAAPDKGILNGPVTGPIQMSSLKAAHHAKRQIADFWIDEVQHGQVSLVVTSPFFSLVSAFGGQQQKKPHTNHISK